MIKRTFKHSIDGILRNGWLTIATVSILIMTLYIISVFFVFISAADGLLQDIKNKSNVSIYFKPDIKEDEILKIKSEVEKISEVKIVEYVSRDVALENFKKANADEPIILESLEEIGENPLLAALVVKAQDSSQYHAIANKLKETISESVISRINYSKNKELINKLNGVIATIQKVAFALGSLLALVSLLITFNAIRITIYAHKQEIEIMRLVGASNMFIRLPFIFEGVIYGIIGSIVSMLLLFVSIEFAAPHIAPSIPVDQLLGFYMQNFWLIFGYQVLLGSFFGILGGFLAMRKYLKV